MGEPDHSDAEVSAPLVLHRHRIAEQIMLMAHDIAGRLHIDMRKIPFSLPLASVFHPESYSSIPYHLSRFSKGTMTREAHEGSDGTASIRNFYSVRKRSTIAPDEYIQKPAVLGLTFITLPHTELSFWATGPTAGNRYVTGMHLKEHHIEDLIDAFMPENGIRWLGTRGEDRFYFRGSLEESFDLSGYHRVVLGLLFGEKEATQQTYKVLAGTNRPPLPTQAYMKDVSPALQEAHIS